MQAVSGRIGALFAAALALAACGGGDPQLMDLRSSSQGPDEFAILPTRPLQMPASVAELPVPVPGAPNLADPRPEADAIAALGGNPAALARQDVPATDAGLLAHAGRAGTAPAIRQTLASEDLEHRRRNRGRLLERLFNTGAYYRAYEDMSLDQYDELGRWRSAGHRTPAAPPEDYEAPTTRRARGGGPDRPSYALDR